MGLKREYMEQWVIDYVSKNPGVSVTDEKFHEEFYQNFGGARKETFFGAQPVDKAMKLLKDLEKRGHLSRSIIGLAGNWQPGFPKWNYVYFIEDKK